MRAVVARRFQIRRDRVGVAHEHGRREVAAARRQAGSARAIGRRGRAPGGRDMTTKSEWQAVNRQLRADQQKRLGEPPAAEELLAYTRGELPAEGGARGREWLAPGPALP